MRVYERYGAWIKADAAWHAAIRDAYPQARFGQIISAKGEPGSALRAAYEADKAARNEFYKYGGALWMQGVLLADGLPLNHKVMRK